ncbi:hypothetical protein J3459_010290 [Metarhizium acridum]|nr:hypothetical protein J3459_010290 [Metarhizium acridum]
MELHGIQAKRDLNDPKSAFYAHLDDIPTWVERLNKLHEKLQPPNLWYSSSDQKMLAEFSAFIQKLEKNAKAWRMRVRVLESGKHVRTSASLERLICHLSEIQDKAGNAADSLLRLGQCRSQIGDVRLKLDELYHYVEEC